MKIKLVVFFAALLAVVSCGKPAQESFTVKGEISGVAGKVYLSVFEGKLPVRIDSTEAANGMFQFTGKVDVPIMAVVETNENPLLMFFLENTPITIQGTLENPKEILVSGSATDAVYKQYQAEQDSMSLVARALTKIEPTASNMDSISNAVQGVYDRMDEMSKQFVKSNPKSVSAAYVLFRKLAYYMDYPEIYESVSALDTTVQQSVYAQLTKSMADALKKTAVGTMFTDFEAPDKEGNMIALSSVAGKGKYVLVDFWASWCGPCRAEMPSLVEAYKQFGPKGFEVYAVSLDKNKEAWLKAIADMKLNWINVSELKFWESTGADLYGVRSIPANILIAPDGKIVARNLRGEALSAKLDELMNTPEQDGNKVK